MGFNFDGAGFDFSTKPKTAGKKKSAEPETDYQKRNKQEQDRRKLATCADYNSIVTFKSEQDLKDMQKQLGVEKLFYAICEIEGIVENFPKQKRDWKIKTTCDSQDVEYWGEKETFEETCKNDLNNFLKLAEIADKTTEVKNVYNSPYYFVIIGKDDNDMQRFLTEHKLFRYGDRFLDGSKWLADIKA